MLVRFAPSPTGYLHVGNARIALANYLTALRQGGQFLLRIDDTDRERSRLELETGIQQDLAWLGIGWNSTFRQSDRLPLYEAAAERLKAAGRLYPCFESEEELRFKREQQRKRGLAPVYDRAMLRMTPAQRDAAEAGGKRPYWRFLLSGREITWRDAVLGERRVKLPSVSDPVLIRADGTPLYTFTSVVDDLETGVTHVIRGEDHVTNTGVQMDIWAALGGDPASVAWAHLPLLVDAEGGKLSKRLDGLSLRGLRQDGIEPAAVAGYLARLGTNQSPALLPITELADSFDLAHVSRASPRFDPRQMLALNKQALHQASFASVQARLPPAATEAFWLAIRNNIDMLSEARAWWDVVAGTIVPPPIEDTALIALALTALPGEPWDTTTWKAWTEAVKTRTGRTGRALFMPLRLALTGEDHGPEMAALLPLIGHERARARLKIAAGRQGTSTPIPLH